MLEIKEFVGHQAKEVKDGATTKKTTKSSTKQTTKKTKDK